MYFMVSLMHTGSRFLVDALDCPGEHIQHMADTKHLVVSVPHTATRFVRTHLDCPYSHAMRDVVCPELADRTIVLPMRHPTKVIESWCKRGRKMHDWIPQWNALIEQYGEQIVLPVDTEDRVERWERQIADVPPPRNWNPVGTVKGKINMTKIHTKAHEWLIDTHGDWLREFYPEI